MWGALDTANVVDDAAGKRVPVTLGTAIPAGTNNIGDVDILTIAAGDNNIGNVDVVTLPALAAGTNNIGDVDVLTLPATTNAGATVKTADYDTGAGTDTVTMIGIALPASGGAVAGGTSTNPVRVDPTGTTAQPITDNAGSLTIDNAALSVTGGGVEATALRVTLASDSTGLVSVDDNNSSLTVDVGTALPAGTNNIGDVDVLSIAAGDNNIGNVDLASAIPAGTNLIGHVGHGQTPKWKTGSASATFTLVAAVASNKIKVYSLSLTLVSTTAVTITFKDGAAGTALATYLLQSPASVTAGIAESVSIPSSLFETSVNTLLEMAFSAAVSVTYNVRYFEQA